MVSAEFMRNAIYDTTPDKKGTPNDCSCPQGRFSVQAAKQFGPICSRPPVEGPPQ